MAAPNATVPVMQYQDYAGPTAPAVHFGRGPGESWWKYNQRLKRQRKAVSAWGAALPCMRPALGPGCSGVGARIQALSSVI